MIKSTVSALNNKLKEDVITLLQESFPVHKSVQLSQNFLFVHSSEQPENLRLNEVIYRHIPNIRQGLRLV